MSYAGFLDAIREDPRSDVPRLICADWLEDNDQPDRAEFIRVQVELSGGVDERSRALDLYRRMMLLLARHRADWLGVLAEHGREPIFERGFIEQVAMSAAGFLAHGESAFREHPIYRLQILSGEAWPDDFGDCPALRHVAALDLHDTAVGDRGLASLGSSPHPTKLTSLDLRHCAVNGSGLKQLLCGPSSRSLVRLNLRDNALGTAGAQALAETPNLPALEELNLLVCNLNDRAAAALARAAGLRRLESMRLSYNRLTEKGVQMILASPSLPALKVLEVYGAEIDGDGRSRLRAQFRDRIVC